MKRLHLHVAVENLEQAIDFYDTLFAHSADVVKDDYAKWMLDDPAINFAISKRCGKPGLNHLGFQVDSDEELEVIRARLQQAEIKGMEEKEQSCCYARANKYWTIDPANIPWENFHTLEAIPTFGESTDIEIR